MPIGQPYRSTPPDDDSAPDDERPARRRTHRPPMWGGNDDGRFNKWKFDRGSPAFPEPPHVVGQGIRRRVGRSSSGGAVVVWQGSHIARRRTPHPTTNAPTGIEFPPDDEGESGDREPPPVKFAFVASPNIASTSSPWGQHLHQDSLQERNQEARTNQPTNQPSIE